MEVRQCLMEVDKVENVVTNEWTWRKTISAETGV